MLAQTGVDADGHHSSVMKAAHRGRCVIFELKANVDDLTRKVLRQAVLESIIFMNNGGRDIL